MKPEKPTSRNLLTKRELADVYRVSTRTVSNWMKSGVLPYLKVGRVVRFDRASVSEALGAFTVGNSADR